MADILRFILALSPVLLIAALIFFRIRRRRKREALGIPMQSSVYSYSRFIAPFSFKAFWMTGTILLALTVVYLCELVFAITPGKDAATPSALTLLAFGAVSHDTVLNHGEWYRLFTAPLLHGGLAHLLFNGIALFYAGRVLEERLGRVWFLSIYGMGAIGGSVLSSVMHQGALLSVGASGAIMGLFAAVMVVSWHATSNDVKQGLRMFSLRILIPSMLPVFSGGMNIDYAAHIGGAAGGGALACVMLLCWPADEPRPKRRFFAGIVALASIILTLYGAGCVIRHYSMYNSIGRYREICRKSLNITQEATPRGTKEYSLLLACMHEHMQEDK